MIVNKEHSDEIDMDELQETARQKGLTIEEVNNMFYLYDTNEWEDFIHYSDDDDDEEPTPEVAFETEEEILGYFVECY